MESLRVGVVLLIVLSVASALALRARVNAVVPAGNFWLWITDKGLVASAEPPKLNALNNTWNVNLVCSKGPLKIYELIQGPWLCRVEAVNLLGNPAKPLVFWNATIRGLKCGERYLYTDLKEMVGKGDQLVVEYPLSESICKRVSANATLINSTMVIRIKVTPIKPWVKICPPSKMLDVILAWGKAKGVEVYVNGQLTFKQFYKKSK